MSVSREADQQLAYEVEAKRLVRKWKIPAAAWDVVLGALRAGKSPRKVTRRWLRKHKQLVPPALQKKPKSVRRDVKPAKADVPPIPLEPAKGVDVKALMAAVDVLRRAGAGVVLDATSDKDPDALRRLLQGGLVQIRKDHAAADAVLRSLDTPLKMEAVGDCHGVFVDATKADCATCADLPACVHVFAVEVRGGMPKVLQKVDPPPPVVEHGGRVKRGSFDYLNWDPKAVFVTSKDPNPNAPGSPAYDLVAAVLSKPTITAKALRDLVEKQFDPETDEAFMKHYVRKLLEARLLFLEGAASAEPAPKSKTKPKKK